MPNRARRNHPVRVLPARALSSAGRLLLALSAGCLPEYAPYRVFTLGALRATRHVPRAIYLPAPTLEDIDARPSARAATVNAG